MKRPTHKRRFWVKKSIPGVAREDEVIIINPKRDQGILVSRWVSWSQLRHIQEHEDSLELLDSDEQPSHLVLVDCRRI